MHNFWRSASTELVALAPRAPFLITDSALPKNGPEAEKWKSANTRSHPYLTYSGNVPPQRQPFAGVPGGAVQESITSNQDIQDITGIYPSSIGARSNETSGKAILARASGRCFKLPFPGQPIPRHHLAGKCLAEIVPAIYQAGNHPHSWRRPEEKAVKLTTQAGETRKGSSIICRSVDMM